MPIIDVKVPAGVFDEGTKARLVERICTTTLKWERIEVGPRAQSVTWAYLEERSLDTLFIGGTQASRPIFRITLTTPQGMLDRERKARLVEELTGVVLEMAAWSGTIAQAANVWCIIHDVPADSWGGGGRLWSYEQIRELVGSEKISPIGG